MKFLFQKPGIYFLIGHRGVGKSFILKQLQKEFSFIFDLDHEIEKKYGNITDFWKKEGEAKFRQLEKKFLQKLCLDLKPASQDHAVIIALGGGFPLEEFDFPEKSCFVWIDRCQSHPDNVYLERPVLDPSKSHVYGGMSHERFWKRQESFLKIMDYWIRLPEGFWYQTHVFDWDGWTYFNPIVTFEPGLGLERLAAYWNQWGGIWEWRDDLEIQVRDFNPQSRWLVSIRKHPDSWKVWISRACQVWGVDVDVRLISRVSISDIQKHFPKAEVWISCHDDSWPHIDGSLRVDRWKWSPVLKSWHQVRKVYQWARDQDAHRLIFERFHEDFHKDDGHWRWAWASRQKYHFVRLNPRGKVPEQIPWYWLARAEALGLKLQPVAAVVGDPVDHSWSPSFHESESQRLFSGTWLKATVKRHEWREFSNLIPDWKLKTLAITSPLKNEVFPPFTANTWVYDKGFLNTDWWAFWFYLDQLSGDRKIDFQSFVAWWQQRQDFWVRFLRDPFEWQRWPSFSQWGARWGLVPKKFEVRVLIFGRGAMAQIARWFLPESKFWQQDWPGPFEWDWLIWAHQPTREWPVSQGWRFGLIWDLNYVENSRARSLAALMQSQYVGGQVFFEIQGFLQKQLQSLS